jgi:hypothetical protein
VNPRRAHRATKIAPGTMIASSVIRSRRLTSRGRIHARNPIPNANPI